MLCSPSLRVGDRAEAMKPYVFQAELVEEEDGRWSAGVTALPGCATWGETREEALRNLDDAVEAYLRDVGRAERGVVAPGAVELSLESHRRRQPDRRPLSPGSETKRIRRTS
jgi:antitoxin HicB